MNDINQPIDFSKIKRVLVTKLRFHGDVLLASPVLTLLKERFPHIEIDALVYQETTDMISLHPALSQLHIIDRNWKKQGIWHQLKMEKQLYSDLSDRNYDLLIHLTESWRGPLLKRLLKIPLAVNARYPRRDNNNFWNNSFSHFYEEPNDRHKISAHVDSLRCLGLDVDESEENLCLAISAEDQQKIDDLLRDNGLVAGDYILLHPTSRFFYKCFPPQEMSKLLNILGARGHKLVVTSAPGDKELQYVEQMLAGVDCPVVSVAGKLSLKQLGAIIARSRCFVGVDSVPMHIASAVGVPLVAMFGATFPEIWAPRDKTAVILRSTSKLSKPALVNGSRPNEIENCILDVPVEKIADEVEKFC